MLLRASTMTDNEYYSEDGYPLKCYKCGSPDIEEKVRDHIDVFCGMGPACEIEYVCRSCGTGVGYWAYGAFDPTYLQYKESAQ